VRRLGEAPQPGERLGDQRQRRAAQHARQTQAAAARPVNLLRPMTEDPTEGRDAMRPLQGRDAAPGTRASRARALPETERRRGTPAGAGRARLDESRVNSPLSPNVPAPAAHALAELARPKPASSFAHARADRRVGPPPPHGAAEPADADSRLNGAPRRFQRPDSETSATHRSEASGESPRPSMRDGAQHQLGGHGELCPRSAHPGVCRGPGSATPRQEAPVRARTPAVGARLSRDGRDRAPSTERGRRETAVRAASGELSSGFGDESQPPPGCKHPPGAAERNRSDKDGSQDSVATNVRPASKNTASHAESSSKLSVCCAPPCLHVGAQDEPTVPHGDLVCEASVSAASCHKRQPSTVEAAPQQATAEVQKCRSSLKGRSSGRTSAPR
jgi:hypothetical protein